MKKSMRFLMSASIALLLGGAAGCRNHIKDIDNTMTDYERTTLRDVRYNQNSSFSRQQQHFRGKKRDIL